MFQIVPAQEKNANRPPKLMLVFNLQITDVKVHCTSGEGVGGSEGHIREHFYYR